MHSFFTIGHLDLLHMRKLTELKYTIIFLFPILISPIVQAQVYSGSAGAIPDNGPPGIYSVLVSALNQSTLNNAVGLRRVGIKLTHTWDSDLDIYLKSPDGTTVLLSGGNGGDGDGYDSTFFTVDATAALIEQNGAPFTGDFWPEGFLGEFNNGQNGNGDWTLIIQDTWPFADSGDLLWWQLEFDGPTVAPIAIDSSNLPLVYINTNNQNIVDEPKIDATMGIIWNGNGNFNHPNDSFNNYNGNIQIEKRGSSSQSFAQVSYGITTVNAIDSSALNFSLLGMHSEHDWILLAPYDDKSLMRNAITYQFANEMGHYAPHFMYCEVFINQQYEGIYLLMEKIKQDNHRVDIAKLLPTDLSGDALSGGYILKVDKWTGSNNDGWESNYRACDDTSAQSGHTYFQYDDPDGLQLAAVQKAYIQGYVSLFENSLHGNNFMDSAIGYRKYIDVNSFIDFSLSNEVSRNIDGYRLSSYLYKERNSKGGKLHCGPLWDFNLTYGNANYYNGAFWNDWEWNFPCPFGDGFQNPFWWKRFLDDSTYVNDLKCRYTYFRANTFSNAHVNSVIDSIKYLVSLAQARHYERYPILGKYTWPNDWLPATYQQEVDTLKNWLAARLNWMDQSLLKDSCAWFESSPYISNSGNSAIVFPNPSVASQTVTLKIYMQKICALQMELFDVTGRKIWSNKIQLTSGSHTVTLSDHLVPGIYLLKLNDVLHIPPMKIVVVE